MRYIFLLLLICGCGPNKDTSSWQEPEDVVSNLSYKAQEPMVFARSLNEVIKGHSLSWADKKAEFIELSRPLLAPQTLGKIESLAIESSEWLTHLNNIKILLELKDQLGGNQTLEKNLSELLLFEVRVISKPLLKLTSTAAEPLINGASISDSTLLFNSIVDFFLAAKNNLYLTLTKDLAQQFLQNNARLKNIPGLSSDLTSKIMIFEQELLGKWLLVNSALTFLEQRSDFEAVNNTVESIPLMKRSKPLLAKEILDRLRSNIKNIGFLLNNSNDDEIIEEILILNNYQVLTIDVKEFLEKSKFYRDGISWFTTVESMTWLGQIINKHTKSTATIIMLKNLSFTDDGQTITRAFGELLNSIGAAKVIAPIDKKHSYLLTKELFKDGLLDADKIDIPTSLGIINHMTSIDHSLSAHKNALVLMAKSADTLDSEGFSSGQFFELTKKLGEKLKTDSSSANNLAIEIIADEFDIKDLFLINRIGNLSNAALENATLTGLKQGLDNSQSLSIKVLAINEIVSKINRAGLIADAKSIDESSELAKASATTAEKQALLTKESAGLTRDATLTLNQAVQTAKLQSLAMIKALKDQGDSIFNKITDLSTIKSADIAEKLRATKEQVEKLHEEVVRSFTDESSKTIKAFETSIAEKEKSIKEKQTSLIGLMKQSVGQAGEAVGSSLLNEAKLEFEKQKSDILQDAQKALDRNTKDLQKRFDESLNDLRRNNRLLEDKIATFEGKGKSSSPTDEATKELLEEYEQTVKTLQKSNRLLKDRNKALNDELKRYQQEQQKKPEESPQKKLQPRPKYDPSGDEADDESN